MEIDNSNSLREELQNLVQEMFERDKVSATVFDRKIVPLVVQTVSKIIIRIKNNSEFNSEYDELIERMIVDAYAVDIAKDVSNGKEFKNGDIYYYITDAGRIWLTPNNQKHIHQKDIKIRLNLEEMVEKTLEEFEIADHYLLSESFRKKRIDYTVDRLCTIIETVKNHPKFNSKYELCIADYAVKRCALKCAPELRHFDTFEDADELKKNMSWWVGQLVDCFHF